MIWCIESYIIPYVKIQKNEDILSIIASNIAEGTDIAFNIAEGREELTHVYYTKFVTFWYKI